MKKRQLTIRCGEPLERALAGRTTKLSRRVNEIAARYFWLIDGHDPDLSNAEWAVLNDALKDSDMAPVDMFFPAIAYHVGGAIAQHKLDEKHGVDGATLVEKLRAMSRAELLAVIDRIERENTLS